MGSGGVNPMLAPRGTRPKLERAELPGRAHPPPPPAAVLSSGPRRTPSRWGRLLRSTQGKDSGAHAKETPEFGPSTVRRPALPPPRGKGRPAEAARREPVRSHSACMCLPKGAQSASGPARNSFGDSTRGVPLVRFVSNSLAKLLNRPLTPTNSSWRARARALEAASGA